MNRFLSNGLSAIPWGYLSFAKKSGTESGKFLLQFVDQCIPCKSEMIPILFSTPPERIK